MGKLFWALPQQVLVCQTSSISYMRFIMLPRSDLFLRRVFFTVPSVCSYSFVASQDMPEEQAGFTKPSTEWCVFKSLVWVGDRLTFYQ